MNANLPSMQQCKAFDLISNHYNDSDSAMANTYKAKNKFEKQKYRPTLPV